MVASRAACLLLVAAAAGVAAQSASTAANASDGSGATTVNPAAASGAAWRSRSIYQLLTDRFGGPEVKQNCSDLNSYCGGSWEGILQHLDYIAGLNVDAVWSSPVMDQGYHGYHGFWPFDWCEVNPHFGTAGSLKRMLEALNQRGFFNMLDVTANHVGYPTKGPAGLLYGTPFSDPAYFHNCTELSAAGVCAPDCGIPLRDFQAPGGNASALQEEQCRLVDLPDLNQSHPFVRQQLLQAWPAFMVQSYRTQGVRVDACNHITPAFAYDFLTSWGGAWAICEVWNWKPSRLGPYLQARGDADYAFQNYLLWPALRMCFARALPEWPGYPFNTSCRLIPAAKAELRSLGQDLGLMVNFIENHDVARFLFLRPSLAAYRNVLAVVLLDEGIPSLYYGTEQGYAGGSGKIPGGGENREPLWPSSYTTSGELYTFVRMLNWYRNNLALWQTNSTVVYSDDATYAFR
ncbi:hypothetical protein ABPG75_003124 [Micractinium tetrahymenae]